MAMYCMGPVANLDGHPPKYIFPVFEAESAPAIPAHNCNANPLGTLSKLDSISMAMGNSSTDKGGYAIPTIPCVWFPQLKNVLCAVIPMISIVALNVVLEPLIENNTLSAILPAIAPEP